MSIKPSYHGFNVWFEGNVSVRKRDKQTCLFCQNYNVDFVFCSLLVFCLFLLKLFALHNRLRKGWFLSLLVCVFFFSNPEALWHWSAVAAYARTYQPQPLALL